MGIVDSGSGKSSYNGVALPVSSISKRCASAAIGNTSAAAAVKPAAHASERRRPRLEWEDEDTLEGSL